MIHFIQTSGHLYTMQKVIGASGAPPLTVHTYDWLFRQKFLPRGSYIFADIDRVGDWDRELAAMIYRRLAEADVRVLNDPARVKTRYAMLRAFYEAGINRFNAYRLDERVQPERYPVFLRRNNGHGEPLSDLLPDWEAVQRASEAAIENGTPEAAILIIEYCAEPTTSGLFRKIGVFRIAGETPPHVCVHDPTWLVKYGKVGGGTPEMYDEENEFVRDNPFAESVMRAFEIAEIDYGRADFGLMDGVPQFYEINTNPDCRPGKDDHPVQKRVESQRLMWRGYLAALSAVDTPEAGAPVEMSGVYLEKNQPHSLTDRIWPAKSRVHP